MVAPSLTAISVAAAAAIFCCWTVASTIAAAAAAVVNVIHPRYRPLLQLAIPEQGPCYDLVLVWIIWSEPCRRPTDKPCAAVRTARHGSASSSRQVA